MSNAVALAAFELWHRVQEWCRVAVGVVVLGNVGWVKS